MLCPVGPNEFFFCPVGDDCLAPLNYQEMDETFIYWAILHCAIAAFVWMVVIAVAAHKRLRRIEERLDDLAQQNGRCRDCSADSVVMVDNTPLCFYHAQSRLTLMQSRKQRRVRKKPASSFVSLGI